jgi:hypothetical protein
VKTLVANGAVGIIVVGLSLLAIVSHLVLSAIADGGDRFVTARRRIVTITAVLMLVLAVVIVARFYYLRS